MEPKRAVSRPKTKVDMIENNSSFFETANQSVGGYDINLNELIGKGSFGKVYKAYKGEQVYAVKIIKKKRIEDMSKIQTR